jgi:hypothetical protein
MTHEIVISVTGETWFSVLTVCIAAVVCCKIWKGGDDD